MSNIYLKGIDLYLVKPSVVTYNTENYTKLEQRREDVDIAIKQENRYFSIFENREYVELDKPDFNKYYINVNEEDSILLFKYIYDNKIKWTEELSTHMSKLLQYIDYQNLERLLDEIDDENHTIKIKKIKFD